MESMLRMLVVALLTVSAASAVQFSVEKPLNRMLAMAGRYEGRLEASAECVSRSVAHRMAHAGREMAAVAGGRKPGSLACGVITGKEGSGMAYGH